MKRFCKSDKDFSRDLRFHIHAVEVVKRLLGANVPETILDTLKDLATYSLICVLLFEEIEECRKR